MKRLLLGALVILLLSMTRAASAADAGIHQLRIYTIPADKVAAFHQRFKDHALRIMARHEFDVLATFQSEHDGKAEFVYLLQWPDEATMKERWAKFLADAEWIEIKRITGKDGALVDEIQDRVLKQTEYSPRRLLRDP